MSPKFLQCPKCKVALLDGVFNLPGFKPCPACAAPLQVEVFPAFFRPIAAGNAGETVMVEGESSCFYHPQKKAAVACEACGRFVCALCDCELRGQHLCPLCVESGRRKQSIKGIEESRALYARNALILALIPLLITGAAAIFMAIKYRKAPQSIVQPIPWGMRIPLILGILQVVAFAALIAFAASS